MTLPLVAAAAFFAVAARLAVLAEAAAAALLASVALPPVLAHAAVTALLAIVALPPVRTRRRKHCGEGDGPRGTHALRLQSIEDRQTSIVVGGETRNEFKLFANCDVAKATTCLTN